LKKNYKEIEKKKTNWSLNELFKQKQFFSIK